MFEQILSSYRTQVKAHHAAKQTIREQFRSKLEAHALAELKSCNKDIAVVHHNQTRIEAARK